MHKLLEGRIRLRYIYITGSNAKLLSGELATYLAGRYVEFIIYPFSLREFLNMPSQKGEAISSSFRKYLQLGGMPFLSNIADNQQACSQYLHDIYNSVILKDVVRRNNIRDVNQLDLVITYILANVGHSFSATSLSKYFKSEHIKVVLAYLVAIPRQYFSLRKLFFNLITVFIYVLIIFSVFFAILLRGDYRFLSCYNSSFYQSVCVVYKR